MPDQTFTVSLINLYCYFVEENEYDDVYLKFNGKKIWPKNKKMKHVLMDSAIDLSVELKQIKKGQSVTIELWDHDWLTPDDLLGTFTFSVDEVSGPFTTDMVRNESETDKAKYTLEWEIN